MRGRIRLAAVGIVTLTVIGAMTSVAGATATVSSWNVRSDAGALDVTLLGHAVEIGGGLTEADANSGDTAEAMGTGLCVNASTPVACPTNVTSPSGASFATTQKAVQNGANGSVAPGAACVANLPLVLVTITVGCGNASASEANGKPTAEGDGSILGGSVNLTLGSALSGMGIALPSLSNAPCAGVSTPAASSTPGSNTAPLTGAASSLLGTVTSITSALKLPTLLPSTVSTDSPTDSTCSILGGLANEINGVPVLGPLVAGLVNGTSLNSVMGTSLLSVSAVESKSTVATGTNNGDGTETASAIGDALDVNVLSGTLDIKVVPAVASATVDTTTGTTTENCTPGLIQVTVNNGTPNLVSLQPLGTALNQLLSALEATALQPLLDALLSVPAPGVLNCDAPVSSGPTSTSVTGGIANLELLPVAGAGGLLGVSVNDVSASASATTANSSPSTSPSSTPTATPAASATAPAVAAAAAPAAASTVPGVTSVHTGEFWAGPLPIILLSGMGLAGMLLIGRRRIFSVVRSLPLITRRRGGV
jgi:hypothetical protein